MLNINTNYLLNLNRINLNNRNNVEKTFISSSQNTLSFKATTYTAHPVIRTQMNSKDEQAKYNELSMALDRSYKNKLNFALKSGKLLNDVSEDKSTVLDNLYKIYKTPRAKGLDNKIILEQSLDILANPYVITQVGEDIPKEYREYFISEMTNHSKNKNVRKNAELFLKEMHMSTCPTASVEFDLATKQPAEFFRIVEGLTSPNVSVKKVIDNDALSNNMTDVIYLLNIFKTPHKNINWDKTEIELKPDKYAIMRARMQTKYQDKGERSIIDILMQSTMMQLGSQQTYNSITDKRATNEWTQDDGGLINFEKTYVESVMENKLTTCVDYQITDENFKLTERTKPLPEIKKDITDALKMGYNIIIGYTWEDEEGRRNSGHEITIVGTQTAKNGETLFICQDSDDEFDKPIVMPESFLIPNLHHAGLPDEIASRNNEETESWKVTLDEYNKKYFPINGNPVNFTISFCSAQTQQNTKGSTPQVAQRLKALNGTLDDKLLKAKDIILEDMEFPSSLIECINQDLGGSGYAAYSAPLGKIIFDKEFCQKPDSKFSDEAIMCILRHELDHMEVFVKLYKKLGREEFEKLIKVLYGSEDEKMPKINHVFYKEMSKYVNIDNFDSDKYIDAINNYYMANEWESHYKNFTDIAKNFDNALENSAREKQYELENLMGVTTLNDFYSMIDETEKLVTKIKANGVTNENTIQEIFDNLYTQALESTGLEDKTQNWGKIVKEAGVIYNKTKN